MKITSVGSSSPRGRAELPGEGRDRAAEVRALQRIPERDLSPMAEYFGLATVVWRPPADRQVHARGVDDSLREADNEAAPDQRTQPGLP